MEFLVTMTTRMPADASPGTVASIQTGEAAGARKLAERTHLLRLWTVPGHTSQSRSLGLWAAHDAADMLGVLESLPLYGWTSTDTVPLAIHPGDPASARMVMT